MKRSIYFVLSLLAFMTACGKDITAPLVDARQINGPCYVRQYIGTTDDGRKVYAVSHYEVCPNIADIDAIGGVASVTKP